MHKRVEGVAQWYDAYVMPNHELVLGECQVAEPRAFFTAIIWAAAEYTGEKPGNGTINRVDFLQIRFVNGFRQRKAYSRTGMMICRNSHSFSVVDDLAKQADRHLSGLPAQCAAHANRSESDQTSNLESMPLLTDECVVDGRGKVWKTGLLLNHHVHAAFHAIPIVGDLEPIRVSRHLYPFGRLCKFVFSNFCPLAAATRPSNQS